MRRAAAGRRAPFHVRGIVEALGHRRAKLCDQAADDVVPVDDRHPPVGLREDEPEDVPVLHRDRLEIVEEAGRKVVRPTTNRFWIPDGFFGGPGNALNLTAVGQGVAVGEHLFVNTYLLGVTICAAAGQSTLALGLRAH